MADCEHVSFVGGAKSTCARLGSSTCSLIETSCCHPAIEKRCQPCRLLALPRPPPSLVPLRPVCHQPTNLDAGLSGSNSGTTDSAAARIKRWRGADSLVVGVDVFIVRVEGNILVNSLTFRGPSPPA
ncbi:hypothetical protein ElyMa_003894400 [Elysia marginata]|uniref:Uncharacterized protein n=1 Tax=Elysia marginata TaxID=1093978 RepID=A0AAV4FME8_9GAST|nr:hypothetical protein ElyMa_003894400 [Elysia marginata]